MAFLIAGLGIIAVCCASWALNGLVFSQLWNWFAVPWLGAPELNVGVAMGIVLIASFLTQPAIQEHKKQWHVQLLIIVVRALLVWFFGWILHFFV